MPRKTYDCAVLGLGGFGSSAAYHVARRGISVLGIEQFTPAHQFGSSHGETRIIRQAYFEHPDYVPLLLRGYELFDELEQVSGKRLFERSGLFLSGMPGGETIQGAHLAKAQHGIPLETVDASHYRERFPGYRIPDGFEVVYEPVAGFLHVEETVRTHLEQAEKAGATLVFDSRVISWRKQSDEFVITTDKAEFIARKLIVAAGAWTRDLLASLDVPLQVRRKVLCWHPVRSNVYDVAAGAPCFFFEMPYAAFYGFPSIDHQTVKLAEHSGGKDIGSPQELIRTELDGDGDAVRRFIRDCMPELTDRAASQAVCMYTMSPDHHFIVDEFPATTGLYFGAGFSGHGFKFTSVIGEILADFAEKGETDLPIDFLRLQRFRTA
ncbi:MAG: N-methyl-L-tryptophan oxidase [Planctomyces sp.]|nr:N-methyl-L-tryptophan oxidase [Planctomyces sp.]